ncbi:MAG: type II secretion system protein [Spartobacteria bacterium]
MSTPLANPRPAFPLPAGRSVAFTLCKVRERESAFTLVELLVVIGIVLVLTLLLAPAFTTLKPAADVTTAAYTIKGVLEQARTYAMANNTYVWVGFYEEDLGTTTPTNTVPPYPGKGRLLTATVGSLDGTKIFDNSAVSATLPADRVKQIGRMLILESIHLTDIGAPPSPPPPSPPPNSLAGRSALPYTENALVVPPSDHYNRISSDSSDLTKFRFVAQGYTFYKTVRFTPGGEANINSTYDLRHVGELGLRPTHGTTVDLNTPNTVAIQFAGMDGNFRIYRQ